MPRTKKKVKPIVKTKVISARVTEVVHELLHQQAEDAGMTLSEFAAQMLMKGRVNISYVFYVHPDEIEAITREFAAIGNNLNQIAAFFNSGGIQSRAMLENINHAISCIFEMREQVAEMAGKNYGNLKAYAESVKYFREENDGKLPSLKSLKKRKEEPTQEIAERKKSVCSLEGRIQASGNCIG